jgi:general secretion pathway protein E
MNIDEIHNINLQPYEEADNIEKAVKNYVLFTKINDKECIAVNQRYMSISFDYLAKQDYDYDIVFLDEKSFDLLYNKFLEQKTEREMESISQDQVDSVTEDEEMSIAEFLKTSSDILTSEESATIIKFVNSLFYQAVKQRASDIHVEMHEFKGIIRYRIDGVLTRHVEIDKNIMSLVISRIKVISNLDISEKRIPQDGRTQIKIADRTLDIRVSVLPTYYGERVVMRILMQSEDIPHLEELGLPNYVTKELEELIKHSHGMILVTGPTGSGKSTTLHALLQKIISPELNIITIEDPVEYKSDDLNQIQVNEKVGLTFASGLRSILRQDPDIIMLGEIRDSETASIAVQSALTGHLVFSTLHTNSATSSVTRLVDMGIEKFLISSSLLGVLAQRLVRVLCEECKEEDVIAESYLSSLDLPKDAKLYKSTGCQKCGYTGYKKRRAIAELFIVNDNVRSHLKGDVEDSKLEKIALKTGMTPLAKQLKRLLLDGETSLNEALRIGLK